LWKSEIHFYVIAGILNGEKGPMDVGAAGRMKIDEIVTHLVAIQRLQMPSHTEREKQVHRELTP
jgi:hypothetical protein